MDNFDWKEYGKTLDRAHQEAAAGGVTQETMEALHTPHGLPTWIIKFDPDTMDVVDQVQLYEPVISEDTLKGLAQSYAKRVCNLIAEGKFPEHLLNQSAPANT